MSGGSKVILVTGGTGLVGEGIKFHAQNRPERWVFISSKDANLLDLDSTRQLFERVRPTHVIHLAAKVGGLFANQAANLTFYLDNMKINLNVLQCCDELNVEKCVSCLSTCVFPDGLIPVIETQVHAGPPHHSNYGYSYAKRQVDVLNRLYHQDKGKLFTSVVPTNVFGPHDNWRLEESHVLPGLIHRCYLAQKNGTPLTIRGTGAPLRQFIFSKDLGALFIWALDHYHEVDPIILSVGQEDEITIKDVAMMIVEAMNFRGEVKFDPSFSDGQYRKTADNTKLKRLNPSFKFTPIKEAIQETVAWFLANYDTCRK